MVETNQPILLSLILPIYNVEQYLEKCVDSILAELSDDCEIILVDDGAKDFSGMICDRYAESDSRIRVIHKENGGLSSARNAGLAVAKGRYVTFVDSDDMIFPDSLPEIMTWIRTVGADMCFLRAFKLFADGTIQDLGENIDGVTGFKCDPDDTDGFARAISRLSDDAVLRESMGKHDVELAKKYDVTKIIRLMKSIYES